jgi:ABC-type transport system substrate-binding protein/class 3 adenylate cyclase
MAVAAGERRIVSVLIADVVNSTAIGETLGPERSKILLDEVVRIMSEQVRRYDGTVAQLVGDELVALFGAPVAHEDDPERAVRAALAIQRALGQYAHEVQAAYGIDLAARIAVNTGPVVVAPQRQDDGYDRWNALGDTVNVASRLQELAERGGILIGPTTKRHVETAFELEEFGSEELKGVSAPVDVYRVTRPRDAEPVKPDLPLVGREFELTVLERTLDGLVEGRGTIVAITGEPGIGKTRLTWEVWSRYRDRIRFVEGRGVSYAQSFPYWPIRDLLREWLGVGATTPEARIRLELKTELAKIFGEGAEEAYPFFATLLGITLEPDAAQRIRELNRESIQMRTFEVFSEWACKLAEEQPLCLVFEDLHWADESTLELLEELLAVTEEASVGLLFLYRSEREHASWRLGERARQRYPHRFKEIELRPLPPDASRVLVANAAEGDLPEAVKEFLAERAGGNPFFLEEAFRDLVERGILQRQNGRWDLAVEPDELAIPALIQGALQARLDRLDPTTRDVLNYAAVTGRAFGQPLLERLVERDELQRALTELQRLDLIVEKSRRPAPEFRFRHGLVQEVAYASLVETKLKKLHRKVGEALEEIYAEPPEEPPYTVVARHFSEADVPEKAAEYLLKAGDLARAIYADQEALEHYKKARTFLARLQDERRARDTLFKMALTYHLAFDFEKAEEMYDEAFCCRVDEERDHIPTERIETSTPRPGSLAPGDIYTTESWAFAQHLFRGLLLVDSELNVVPAMADNMRVSSDGTQYLFRLKEGVRWSDGEPLTAEDFAFAWQSMRDEQTLTAFLMEDVEAAEALDERTLEIRLREPRGYFPYLLSQPWAFPWPRHICRELGEDWRKPENIVGNGPFVLAEWHEDHAVLLANPHWVGPRGNVGEVHVSFGLETADEIDAWREGRFDTIRIYRKGVTEAPDTLVEIVPELTVQFLGFNVHGPVFANALVRKAFSHAVDRERLVEQTESLHRAATLGGAIPPAMPGHSHRVAPEYNLELAKTLLAEAGYPEGRGLPELELALASTHRAHAGTVLTEGFTALGAQVHIREVEGKLGPTEVGDSDLWMHGWTADYPDPDGFFRGFFRMPWPFYRDEELEEMLAEARSLKDQGERLRIYHQVDQLWVSEHAAILPLSYSRAMIARRPWLEGLGATPLSQARLDQLVVARESAAAIQVPDEAEALQRQ